MFINCILLCVHIAYYYTECVFSITAMIPLLSVLCNGVIHAIGEYMMAFKMALKQHLGLSYLAIPIYYLAYTRLYIACLPSREAPSRHMIDY